ncbi:MAG TPA: hypothetical protein VJJ24_00750 [Candidatus Paceibacterota bacterium]
MKNSIFLVFFSCLIIVTGLFFATGQVPKAEAANVPLTGWAWSSNVGWVSFNCNNQNACGTSNYSVNMDDVTGLFSGYAWSSNIGWINFNQSGLSGCPSGTCEARLVNNKVTGWAKALNGNSTSGWLGWIHLSDPAASPKYTASLNSQAFQGFSWGEEVVGWMKWNPNNGGVHITDPNSFLLDVTVSHDGIAKNSSNPVFAVLKDWFSISKKAIASHGFNGWGGAGEACGHNIECTITINANTYVTADFGPDGGSVDSVVPAGIIYRCKRGHANDCRENDLQAGTQVTLRAEICNNGIDDDGDGLIDEDCPGFGNISASCTISTNKAAVTIDSVTWAAIASGGSGSYTYLWHGTVPLEGRTGQSTAVTYSTIGIKTGYVTVTDSGGQIVNSLACTNPNGGTTLEIGYRITTGVIPGTNNLGGPSSGSGTITNNFGGTACSVSLCQYIVSPGTITLTFSPGSNSIFQQWVNGAGQPTSLCAPGSSICTFTIGANETVKAQSRKSQCDDGVDNDGDGLKDYLPPNQRDPQCTSRADDSEFPDAVCGNGIVEFGEQCDGSNLNGQSCVGLGYSGGVLSCNSDCLSFDVSQCTEEEDDGGPVECPADGNDGGAPTGLCPVCWDGVDNDGDGLTDYLQDPSCGGNPFSDTEGVGGEGVEEI